MVRSWLPCLLLPLLTASLFGQTPQPFPRAGTPAQPQATRPAPAQQAPAPAPPPPAAVAPDPAANPDGPTAASLGFPIYPGAQFLASYDAGRGQRYYLFGTSAAYAELVTYYRAQLKERGDQVFDQPLTHMFQVGRFREETMAFPPGVTVKDWSTGASGGYLNPKPGGEPMRFPTVVMIVPAPAAAAPAAR